MGSGDDVEKLISRTARVDATAVAASPRQLSDAVLTELTGRELFVALASGQSPQGQPVLLTYTANGVPSVVRAYVSRRRQGIRYGGMRWEVLRDMVCAAPGLGGVQVVNDADDWVLFDRSSLCAAVTYYAKLRDGGSADDPTGIVRRTHADPPVDEAFGRDMRWHSTEFLRRFDALGTSDVDHVEISRTAAEAILDRWRSEWTAGQ